MLKTFLLSTLAFAAFAGDFFPLANGNTWTYKERRTGQTFTIRAGTPVMHDGAVYYSLRGYTDQALQVRLNHLNNLVYWDDDAGTERLLTSFERFEGGWFAAPFRPCEHEGKGLEKPGSYSGPAGNIEGTLEIRYRSYGCADTGWVSEQYAENIGMLERTVTTFAGPRTYDLVYARVGNITVEGLPMGRFTISVDDPPQGDNLVVTLRVSVRPATGLTLTFPTAQEYDIILRDLTGRVVYKWSTGQVFDQAVHQRTIAGEWQVTLNIPRPVDTAAYTVEGWLTTVDQPKFAAATTAGAALP